MVTEWEDWPEGRREAVCAWLTANNIQPDGVPIDTDLYIEPGPDGTPHIHYEAFHLDSTGHRHLDERGQDAAIETRTTPLLVDPPDWWKPHRKPTRDQLLENIQREKRELATLIEAAKDFTNMAAEAPASVFASGWLAGLAMALHIQEGSTAEKEIEKLDTELGAQSLVAHSLLARQTGTPRTGDAP